MRTLLKFPLLVLTLVCLISCQGTEITEARAAGPQQGSKLEQPKLTASRNAKSAVGFSTGLADKAGNMWFGTSGNGVFRYANNAFTHFTTNNGLASNFVYSIIEDKAGNIWFGTDSGLCYYNGKTFTYVPIPVGGSGTAFVNPAYNNATAKKISVISIMQDKSGKIWFCTSAGVHCYDGKSVTPFLTDPGLINKNKLNLQSAQNVLEDKAGNIWFTTWFEGIVRFDGKALTSYKPNNEVWFMSLLEDRNGNIWTTRRGKGLIRYNGTTFESVLQHGTLDSCSALANLQDRQGNIWFTATHTKMAKRETTGGLWRYDGKTFTNFLMKDGLPSNSVLSIVEDKSGNIWAGTRGMGLVRFDGETFTNFSPEKQ